MKTLLLGRVNAGCDMCFGKLHLKRQVIIKMNKFNMFITAVCVLFLIKLRWPKNKSIYVTFAKRENGMTRTHATDLGLNTRAFAPPFPHVPFIPGGRTKECQECAHIWFKSALNIEETWYRGLRQEMFYSRAYVLMLISLVSHLLMLMLCYACAYAYALVKTTV